MTIFIGPSIGLVMPAVEDSSAWVDEHLEDLFFKSGGVLSCEDPFLVTFDQGCASIDEDVFFGRAGVFDVCLLFLGAGKPDNGSSGRSYNLSLSRPRERFLTASLTTHLVIAPLLMGVNDFNIRVGATESLYGSCLSRH